MTAITLKAIDAKLATFRTSRTALQDLGHVIAMMIFDHAFATDDATRALALAKEMPKSWEPQLTAWFKAFTPVLVIKSRDEVGLHPKFKTERKAEGGVGADKSPVAYAKWWKRDEAMATPFHLFAEPEAEKPLLDFAALVAMVTRLSKTIASKVEKGEVKAEDIPSANAIAATIAGLSLKPVVIQAPKVKAAPKARKPKVVTPAAEGVTGDEVAPALALVG